MFKIVVDYDTFHSRQFLVVQPATIKKHFNVVANFVRHINKPQFNYHYVRYQM